MARRSGADRRKRQQRQLIQLAQFSRSEFQKILVRQELQKRIQEFVQHKEFNWPSEAAEERAADQLQAEWEVNIADPEFRALAEKIKWDAVPSSVGSQEVEIVKEEDHVWEICSELKLTPGSCSS